MAVQLIKQVKKWKIYNLKEKVEAKKNPILENKEIDSKLSVRAKQQVVCKPFSKHDTLITNSITDGRSSV